MTEDQGTPPTSENPPATSVPAETPSAPARYAVYDKEYLRFVGPVHDSKAKATKEAKDRKLSKFEIREV